VLRKNYELFTPGIDTTLNDYVFMLMPMVDNFWQAQAVLMLTPRMPLYIPCVYNVFMYWPCVCTARICQLGCDPTSSSDGKNESLGRLAEASFAGLLGAVLYAPYDLCGARFLWWTWHLDDAGVKLRWAENAPLAFQQQQHLSDHSDLPVANFEDPTTSPQVAPSSPVIIPVPGTGGGVPAGSTAFTLVFIFCFAYWLRVARDKSFGFIGTTLLVAGLTTFSMMGLLTALSFLAGDRMGMPGPYTLWMTIALLVLGSLPVFLRRSPSSSVDKS